MKTPSLGLIAILLLISLTGCEMSASPPVAGVSAVTPSPTAPLAAAHTPALAPFVQAAVTSTATGVPTSAPTATWTATATSTSRPTPSHTPAPTATPAVPRVLILKAANIRGGPGTNYSVVASAKAGTKYKACGRNQAGDWVQLSGHRDPQWWVYVGTDLKLAEMVGSPVAELKLVDQIPTPPLPTNTPDPCYGATARGARQRFTFEQIVSCLKTPARVSDFMRNNIRWDGGYDPREHGGNEYAPAWLVYDRGIDDCDGHAILQCYLLERNGWNAYMIGLSIEGPSDIMPVGWTGKMAGSLCWTTKERLRVTSTLCPMWHGTTLPRDGCGKAVA